MRWGLMSLATAAAIACSASMASAADIPAARPVYKAPVMAPVFSWTGFYLGLNAGYGWGDVELNGFGTTGDLRGFVGGGQIGYNWQVNQFVFGVEADFQGTAIGRTDTVGILGVPVSIDQNLNWFGTVRGRAGLAFDRVMVYVTGGWAYINYEITGTVGAVSVSSDTSRSGWVVGGGLEWMFMPKWSLKGEYLFIDTGNQNITMFGATATGNAQFSVARGGINYHF